MKSDALPMKHINTMYSPHRSVAAPGLGSVTIREIEERLTALNPSWSQDDVRIASVLFAILKEGTSTQKLLAFTRYSSEFLLNHVEYLRQRGLLITGTLSTQFVLNRCPGAEDLVERITGQRIVKETPMNEEANGHAALNAGLCDRPGCDRPQGHSGHHKGKPQGPRKAEGSATSRSEIARKGAAARWAKQRQSEANEQKNAAASAVKRVPEPMTAEGRVSRESLIGRGDGLFKIEYEDTTLSIRIDGAGRQLFVAMAEIIHTSLTGGIHG
jgi:hypothetical protein